MVTSCVDYQNGHATDSGGARWIVFRAFRWINIALEGKMLAGAFTAAAVTYAADMRFGLGNASPWVGLLAGMFAGILIAAIYALSCIKFKADQVVERRSYQHSDAWHTGFFGGALFLSSGSTPQLRKIICCRIAVGHRYRDRSSSRVDLVRHLQNTVRFATAFGGGETRSRGCGGCERERMRIGRSARGSARGYRWCICLLDSRRCSRET